jgi:hypothetical protein
VVFGSPDLPFIIHYSSFDIRHSSLVSYRQDAKAFILAYGLWWMAYGTPRLPDVTWRIAVYASSDKTGESSRLNADS